MSFGANLVTAVGVQTEKGTPASDLIKLRATSNNLEATAETGQSEVLNGNRFADEQYITGYTADGSIDAEVSKETIKIILEHAIGGSFDEETGVGVFKPSQTLNKWLTFLKFMTDVNYHELFTDCRINQLTLNIVSRSVLTYSLDIMGIKGEAAAGPYTGNINPNTGGKLFAWDVNVVWDNDISSIVEELTITHNNNIDGNDYGLYRERQSLDAQDSEHTFSLTTKIDASLFADMKNDLKQGNVITGVTINIGKASDGTTPFLSIYYPKVKLTQVSAPVGSRGRITADIEAIALWDDQEDTNVIITLTE